MYRSEASEGLERLGGDRRGKRGGHGSDRLRPSVPLALLPYFRAWRGCGIGWGRSQVEIYSERNEHSAHDEARLQPKASLTRGSKRGHADTMRSALAAHHSAYSYRCSCPTRRLTRQTAATDPMRTNYPMDGCATICLLSAELSSARLRSVEQRESDEQIRQRRRRHSNATHNAVRIEQIYVRNDARRPAA